MSKMTAEELANLLISIYEETIEKTGGDSIMTIMALDKIIETCRSFATKQNKGGKDGKTQN